MLSLKTGAVAPQRTKGPLLALMTPELCALFDNTVEPLLDVVRLRSVRRASIVQRPAVVTALAELEAPIVAPGAAASTSASASASSSSAAAGAGFSSSSSSTAARKKARGQQPAASNATWLTTLFLDFSCPAAMVVDFLGGNSALRGIGSAAPALRAVVKGELTSLKVNTIRIPPLEEFPRLQKLHAHTNWNQGQTKANMVAKIVSVGLPARLQSFRAVRGAVYNEMLVSHQWPQLRILHLDYDWASHNASSFLDAVTARPTLVFPRLKLLVEGGCGGEDGARKLLALLDRGAFPSLTWWGFINGPTIEESKFPAAAQRLALFRRLPHMDSLTLRGSYSPQPINLATFAPFVSSGGFAHLKILSIQLGYSGNRRCTPFFNALGSGGALPRLQHLALGRPEYSAIDYMENIGKSELSVVPNSLPSLRSLRISNSVPHALLDALFTAAGSGLTDITITVGLGSSAAVQLMAEQDYLWMPSLQRLSLKWKKLKAGDIGIAWEDDTARNTAAALAHLPALKQVKLEAPEYDELVVRLLVLAEGGGLRSLTTLTLVDYGLGPTTTLSNGALLLLLLWLKREVKKAVEGQEAAVTWEVEGLPFEEMQYAVGETARNCFAQIREARRACM